MKRTLTLTVLLFASVMTFAQNKIGFRDNVIKGDECFSNEDYECALHYYMTALDCADKSVTDDLEEKIDNCRRMVTMRDAKITFSSTPVSSVVFVDKIKLGTTPVDKWLAPGGHTVTFKPMKSKDYKVGKVTQNLSVYSGFPYTYSQNVAVKSKHRHHNRSRSHHSRHHGYGSGDGVWGTFDFEFLTCADKFSEKDTAKYMQLMYGFTIGHHPSKVAGYYLTNLIEVHSKNLWFYNATAGVSLNPTPRKDYPKFSFLLGGGYCYARPSDLWESKHNVTFSAGFLIRSIMSFSFNIDYTRMLSYPSTVEKPFGVGIRLSVGFNTFR